MKQFFKMFFASLLAMIVAGVIMFGMTIGMMVAVTKSFSEKKNKETTGNILVVDLTKKFHEQSEKNSLAILNDGDAYEAGLYDITRALGSAKKDNEVKGILLKLGGSPNGWATLQQLRMSLLDFKTSGKFIYAYGEDITQGAYFVASVADSIYLNPAGGIDLKGLATVMPFFKGTLDRLELQPEIFYAGKFKSATEPFRADKMSDPNRQQIGAMQAGLWDQFLGAAADYMHTDKNAINKLATDGAIQFPTDALNNKMVAGLLYWDQVEARMKAKMGSISAPKYISMAEYAETNSGAGKIATQKIALLIAEGYIVDGTKNNDNEIASKTFCEAIRRVRDNDKIKAVVMRVNSPGGSALASEVILRELTLLQIKKPLVVSMGDYAASGGYYISSSADRIYALPNTITGSIGVFSMMFSMDKLLKDKMGITFDEVKNAPFADIPTNSRPLTVEEGQRMQHEVDNIYDIFKNHVVQGRKLNRSEVDSIAQGRVWTGTDALGIHLVDAIGGLDAAILGAANLAHITDYKVVAYPEEEDKLENLLRKIKSNTSASAAVKTAIKEETGTAYTWYEELQNLRKVNGKAMMAMPFVPVVE